MARYSGLFRLPLNDRSQGVRPTRASVHRNSVMLSSKNAVCSCMTEFDYSAPAELYPAQGRQGFKYRRFLNAGEAIRYPVEKLPTNLLPGTRLQVEDGEYDDKQIHALYESERYPLPRKPPSP
jgi:hypothetical protein